MNPKKLKLDHALVAKLTVYCSEHLISPTDLLRIAILERPVEPLILSPIGLYSGPNHTRRMLSLLKQIAQKAPDKFSEAAQGIEGNKRLWFSKNKEEITKTGNANQSKKIEGSDWYVSINCSPIGLKSRVSKLMKNMHFSNNYIAMAVEYIAIGRIYLDISEYFE